MAAAAVLAIKIVADASQARKGLDEAAGSVSKTHTAMSKMALPAAAAITAIAAFGLKAGKSAAEAEQAMGAVDAVFGKTAKAIHKFGETSADVVGLSTQDYENMAATFGAQLKNMGTSSKDLAPQTNGLIQLGADLAAQFGGETSQAVEALGSLLRGETDPIEKYGVSIKKSDVEAQKAAMGLSGLTGEAGKAADKQATLALLTQQTADAHGAFAREADTASGAQQRANAKWEDAQAKLGQALLPTMGFAADAFSKLSGLVEDHSGVIVGLVGVVAGLSGTILVVNGVMKAWSAITAIAKGVTTAFRIAQFLLNVVMAANPIGLVVLAIIALVAIFVVAYKNSETFRRIVDAAFRGVKAAAQACWNWIKANWPLLLAILTGPIGLAVLAIVKNWDKIKDGAAGVLSWLRGAWDAIRGILVAPFQSAWDTISGIIGRIRDAVSSISRAIKNIPKPSIPHIPGLNSSIVYAPTPSVAGRSTAGTRAGAASSSRGGGVVINVNGALDPDAVARQIRKILDRADVRAGRRQPYQRSFATP